MAKTETAPAKTESRTPAREEMTAPFETLRREIDRLFEEFRPAAWRWPFGRAGLEVKWPREGWGVAPAMDVSEKDDAYEISAELPGMDESNIEIKLTEGMLTIRGEKREEKEERKKEYYLSERRFGSFQRSFQLPAGVDTDKIEANFAKGVLTVTMPKTPEAKHAEKKIDVKAG